MELVRRGAVKDRPQVLLRPCPVDDGSRYNAVRKAYPELIYAAPRWEPPPDGEWLRWTPLPEDIQFLANLTYYADVNVNLASTMTLDFSIRNKPVVNIAFDVADPPLANIPLWDHYYQWEHYQPVVRLGAARFARSVADLAAHINAYLENPALDSEGRCHLVNLQVGVPVGKSTEAIVETLRRIVDCGH
jgi:hypothetical protein